MIIGLKKPLVGRINGHAMGGGLGLATACDITVAAEDCKFGTPEANVGLFPYVIMATLLRVAIAPKRLLEMMLAGERIWNLERVFNIREGVGEDMVANRLYNEDLEDGRPGGEAISKERFIKARAMYYKARGWAEDGKPTAEKLRALGLAG